MGPRIGRFDKKGNPVPMPGHSVPLSALGGLILIFGFFACNGTKQVRKQLFLLVSKRDLGEYARKERQLIGVKRIHKWILHTNSIQCENSKDTLPRYTLHKST